MRLVSIEEARVVELMMITRAQGQLHLPRIVETLQETFQFSGVPDSLDEIRENGLKLTDGIYREMAIGSLAIHSDGIVVDSRSPTKMLENFVDHLKEWARENLDVTFVRTHRVERLFDSSITVESQQPLLQTLDVLQDLNAYLQELLEESSGYHATYRSQGFSLSVDPQESSMKPKAFRIERKLGVNYTFNQYFASAPLPTEKLFLFLKKLEQMY